MLTLSRQLRAARALIGWEQVDLAEAASVAIGTIRRMESEAESGPIRGQAATLLKVQRALESAGVEFIDPFLGTRPERVVKKAPYGANCGGESYLFKDRISSLQQAKSRDRLR